jgi:hypothetical protein
MLNLTHVEQLFVMNKMPYFDDPIEFDSLLVGVLCISVHDTIKYLIFDARRIVFYRGQLLSHIQSV